MVPTQDVVLAALHQPFPLVVVAAVIAASAVALAASALPRRDADQEPPR